MVESPYLTLKEAAAYAGVSEITLRRWISAGKVPAYRQGPRLIKIKRGDLERLIRPIPTARD